MSDLNDVKLFLGIRINRKSDCITLDQSAYVKTILNNFGISDCKIADTPMESKVDFVGLNSEKKMQIPLSKPVGFFDVLSDLYST